ncbi:MAG: hypothetical protein ACI9N9_000573 [Enterobacterales bacterium]|jgi:hypothetical protein
MAEKIKHFVSSRLGKKGLMDTIPMSNASQVSQEYAAAERLNFPCEEPLDLRDLFPTECTAFKQDAITHFLDDNAKRFYLKQLKRNSGHYTQAIYQAVLKHAAARLSSGMYGPVADEKEDPKDYNPPAVIPVGYSQHRQENRLNYASDIEIELPSGKIIQARSVNISPSGIQIKLHQLLDVIDGMEMNIAFPSLEEKYEQELGMVPYRLMKNSVGSIHMTLQLARIEPGEHSFDIFIQDFIDNKKHRYRLDSEDSKLALTAKAWEYFYINSLPFLACFVATNGERLQIQEIAISNQNKQHLKGLGNSMLSILEQQMSSFRLNRIIQHENSSPEIYAYRYQGSGLRRRIAATSWQFNDHNTKLTFLRTGINQDTFRAWRVKVVKLHNMSEQRSKELLDKLAEVGPEQAENLIDQLNQYEYLIYLVEITDSLKKDPLLQHDDSSIEPDDSFFDDYEIRRAKSVDYTRLRLGINKQRNEVRYIYKSPIVLKYYGEKLKGLTLDLSVNGLKIQLDKPSSFQIRDTVTIDFVGLNKRFRSADLKNQSYRIAAITADGGLCLTRDHRIARHEAAIFINKLLIKNKGTLPSCTGELWMSTKSRLIESWLNLCLPTQSLLITRNAGVYNIPYILDGDYTAQLLAPFQIGIDLYNLETIFECKNLRQKLRSMSVNTDTPPNIEIYVYQQSTSEDSIPTIELKTWSDFDDDIERVEYIQKCCRYPVFGFYSLTLCKVPRLEKSYLLEDINVIRRNARHRLSDFEKEYQSLVAVMELTDRTSLVLERYNLN